MKLIKKKKKSCGFKLKQKRYQSPSFKANRAAVQWVGVKAFNSHGFAAIDVLPQHGFGQISKLHLCFFVEVK